MRITRKLSDFLIVLDVEKHERSEVFFQSSHDKFILIMSKTVIFSGNNSFDLDNHIIPNGAPQVSLWRFFPEIEKDKDGLSIPLHPKQIIEKCPSLKECYIITVSEHIILYFLKEIRLKRIAHTDVELYWLDKDKGNMRQLRIDVDGDLLDMVPGGFFDERGDLLFGK